MTLKYTREHEWVDISDDIATVGITYYAQEQLGDVVFVDLPATGELCDKGSEVAVVESVKAASDIYAPLTGQIIESNSALSERPELINEDPENDGWFFRLRFSDLSDIDDLMDEADYQQYVQEQL